MKVHLIDKNEIRTAWSVRWAALTAALAAVPVAYAALPADWLPAIPDWVKAALAYAVLASAATTAAVRVIQQPPKGDQLKVGGTD